MTVHVLVPVSPDRQPVWQRVRHRWRGLHPEWNLVECPAHDPWNKGLTLNPAIDAHDGVLVLADCDLLLSAEALRGAVETARRFPWVMPFRWLYRLGPELTEALSSPFVEPHKVRKRDGLESRSSEGRAGGGIVVARSEALREVGGFDPRFWGWGREDISLGAALDTLVGPHVQIPAHLWHLHHARAQARHTESRENFRLASRYEEARGDPDAMRALIGER